MLQIIIEQPRAKPFALQVRDDTLVDSLVSALVERLRFPRKDRVGAPVIYRLYGVGHGKALPGDQRFVDLHIQSGVRVYVGIDTVPIATKQHIGRRAALSLLAVSTAGFLLGTSAAFAQRRHPGGTVAAPPVHKTTVTAQQQLRFTAHTAPVRAVAWSPHGALLASGGSDAMLLLWLPDGTVKQRVSLPDAIRSLAWSPDGMRIAAGSGAAVAFIQVQTGQLLAFPQAHRAAVTSVAWSTHIGNPVLSGSLDRRALVWQTQDYRPQGSFTMHTAPVEAVTVTPDGTTVASSSEGGVIRVWDLDTFQEVHGFYQDAAVAMLSAAFAPDGMRLAVGGQDGIVRVWEKSLTCQNSVAAGGEPHCIDVPLRLRGHTAPVRAVAWSFDGRYLATAGEDGQVIVWDSAAAFAHIAKITHDAPVTAVSWSPGHYQLATASGNIVQIWKIFAANH